MASLDLPVSSGALGRIGRIPHSTNKYDRKGYVKLGFFNVCLHFWKSYYIYYIYIYTCTTYSNHCLSCHHLRPHEIGNCPNLWLEWNAASLCFGPWGLIASSNKPPRIRQTMVIPGQISIWYPMTCWVSPPPRLFTVKTDFMLITGGKNISHRDAQKVVACTTWAACWTGCRSWRILMVMDAMIV